MKPRLFYWVVFPLGLAAESVAMGLGFLGQAAFNEWAGPSQRLPFFLVAGVATAFAIMWAMVVLSEQVDDLEVEP